MANSKNIKLPLSSFGFEYLCSFIKTLHEGLDIVAEGVDTNAADIAALTNEIIAGEVKASLSTQSSTELATQSGEEIYAIRIFS